MSETETTQTSEENQPDDTNPDGTKDVILSLEAKGAAVALIVLYIGLILYFVGWARDFEGEVWTRLMMLFTSVEAIVFAAAGALFGVQIERTATKKMKEAADQNAAAAKCAREKAEDATKEAVKNQAAFSALYSTITRKVARARKVSQSPDAPAFQADYIQTLGDLNDLAESLAANLEKSK